MGLIALEILLLALVLLLLVVLVVRSFPRRVIREIVSTEAEVDDKPKTKTK